MKNNTKQILIKTLLTIVAAALSGIIFGLCIPFLLLAANILPHIGIGSIVYILFGGAFGLVLGGILNGRSLFKSEKLITKFFIQFTAILLLILIIYFIIFFSFPEAFSHI